MWRQYSFKLAYANDNTFTMDVNPSWTLSEFTTKVRDFARLVFPQIDVSDEFHITESWNHLRIPTYGDHPAEENQPILTEQNQNHYIDRRYAGIYRQNLCFYIYFKNMCESLRDLRLNGESATCRLRLFGET